MPKMMTTTTEDTPLTETLRDKKGFLAELKERTLSVMTEVSDAQADDRLDVEELAAEVVSLAQTMHGLLVMLQMEEAEERRASGVILGKLDKVKAMHDAGKPAAGIRATMAIREDLAKGKPKR